MDPPPIEDKCFEFTVKILPPTGGGQKNYASILVQPSIFISVYALDYNSPFEQIFLNLTI